MKIPMKVRRIIVRILYPFLYAWLFICWCIMKIGRGIYWFGNMLSGFKLDPWRWTQEI